MSYFKPVPHITMEMCKEFRESNPGVGLNEAKQAVLKQRADKLKHNALEAVESCRFPDKGQAFVDATVLDLLEYLIRK